MKTKYYTILLIFVLLGSSFSIQALSDNTENNPIVMNNMSDGFSTDNSVNNDISENNPMINNPMIINQNALDQFIPTQDRIESPIYSGYHNIEKVKLPDGLKYFSEINTNLFDRFQSGDAVVKVYDDTRIELIVKSTSTTLTLPSDILQKYDVKIIRKYADLNSFTVSVPEYKMDSFIKEVSTLLEIAYIEPNFYKKATFIPNDPEWANQYGPQIIGMETAWDIQMGNNSTLVAIIDTGIDYTHPDLGNYLPLGYDFYNDDADPFDDNGHGTHVAGTIGATINNGIGVAGVAATSFFAEKFLDAGGYGSDIGGANAIIHAVDQGADILSNSWGGGGYSQTLADAVAYAINSSVIVVAASGNGATNAPSYPAAYPGVISVGATDINDELAYFSNWGENLDIVAPGVNIISTLPGNSYAYYSGTSMATPHVSGALALLMAHYPDYTPGMIENLLYNTATDLGTPGWDEYFGWGRIDVSTAIYGLQDHDLLAKLNIPKIIPQNTSFTIDAAVQNNGLMNETAVSMNVTVNDVLIYSDFIPTLLSGDTYNVLLDYFPAGLGTYNVSVDVSEVIGENITSNNHVMKTVVVSDPVINPQTGDVMIYSSNTFNNLTTDIPFDLKFLVHDASDKTNVEFGIYMYDEFYQEEILIDIMYVNTITRESSLWDYFPYWIPTDLQIGDTFPLFSDSQPATVIGETTYIYYGELLDVWIVDDGYELVYFSKSDGILFEILDYNYNPIIYSMIHTNILPFALDNVNINLITPIYAILDEFTEINFLVWNTGDSAFTSNLEMYIGSELIYSNSTTLNSGEYMYFSASWFASSIGTFDLTLFASSVSNETYFDDNSDYYQINVLDLQNYSMSYPAYNWYDAMTNGVNLGLIGDDTFIGVDMPFAFSMYDMPFSTVYISSNGWLSFGEADPYEYYGDAFPNPDHPFAVSVFWSDLIAENNVYAWSTSEFLVIEFNNFNYLWNEFAGTFQVVFFPNGDILFQYQNMGLDQGTIKGLNYGLNLAYYNVIPDDLSYMTDFAVRFSLSTSNDFLVTDMYVPDIEEGQSNFIYAFVSNIGTETMYDVYLYLFINDEIKSAMYTQVLPAGENLTLIYYWQNVPKGDYIIRADAPPMPGEDIIDNNVKEYQMRVGQIHDLQVSLDIYFDGNMYVITVIVENIGDFDESYVQFDLYIDGILVNIGFLSYLGAGTVAATAYFWTDYTDGNHDIMAYVYPVIEEENIDNNTAYDTITVVDVAMINFIVFDNNTGVPVENASIMLYSTSGNYSTIGYTNEFGELYVEAPLGEYFISIYEVNYDLYEFYALFDISDYYDMFISLTKKSGNTILEFQLYDNETGGPVSNTYIYVYNINTGDDYYGRTDVNGFLSFEITLGEYFIDIYPNGYNYINDYQIFDQPGNTYTMTYYLIPWGIDGTAFVDINVVDEVTGSPVANTNIDLYNMNTGQFYYGTTDSNGFISFEVSIGEYYLNINVDGYNNYFSIELFDTKDAYYNLTVNLTPWEPENVGVLFNIYDELTGNPISDAQINMYNIYSGQYYLFVTDINGQAYGNVSAGEYYLTIEAMDYLRLDDYLSLNTPDSFNEFTIYLTPLSSLPSTTVSFEVYDITTGLPLEGVEINMYNYDLGIEYLFTTDANGMLVANITLGYYSVSTNLPGYTNYKFEDRFDQQGYVYNIIVYLEPLPARDIEFITPTPGEMLEGGVIYAEINTTDISSLNYIDVFINGVYITSVYGGVSSFIIPIFSNGTNFIELYAYWYDGGYAYTSISIESYNVISTLDIIPGDYFVIELQYLDGSNRTTYYEFDVLNWVSEFEVYINFTIFENGIVTMNFYMVVNLINGYISDADFSWIYTHFFVFSNLDTGSTGLLDKSAFIAWNDVYTIFGETIWNGYDVWIMQNIYLDEMYIVKSNALMTSFYYQSIIQGTMIDTSFFVNQAPVFEFTPLDFEFEQGTLNNTVSWMVSDDDPYYYRIYINSIEVMNGTWLSNEMIILDLDSLNMGNYSIIIYVYDISGNMISDEVFVNVFITTTTLITGSNDLSYEMNTINNQISWKIDGDFTKYTVSRNDELIVSSDWDGEKFIILNIDGLDAGKYEFVLTVYDTSDNIHTDTIIVYVLPNNAVSELQDNSTDRGIGFELFLAILAIIGLAGILGKKYISLNK